MSVLVPHFGALTLFGGGKRPREEDVHTVCEDWGDVPFDIAGKESDAHDEYCCHCNRQAADFRLTGCAAANCYASFCHSSKCGAIERGAWLNSLFVCGMCMNASTPIGDDFDDGDKSSTDEKRECNKAFVALCQSLGAERVLVLDGGECQTTETLLAWNSQLRVLAPNPDTHVCAALRKAGAEAFPVRVGGFLTRTRKLKSCAVTCAWLDYTGTYEGSKTTCVYPKQDLWKLWNTGLDRTASRVALVLTVSKRNAQIITDDDEIVREQMEMANRYGWKAELTHKKTYGQMVQFTFVATHGEGETSQNESTTHTSQTESSAQNRCDKVYESDLSAMYNAFIHSRENSLPPGERTSSLLTQAWSKEFQDLVRATGGSRSALQHSLGLR